MRDGEQLRGHRGPLTVTSLSRVPGVHRVYNMTVESEHVYRVATLGVLVHNNGCYEPGSVVQDPNTICFVAGTPVLVPDELDKEAATELTTIETTSESSQGGLLACGIVIAAAGFGGWHLERRQIRRKRREEEESQELIDQLFGGTDLLDQDDGDLPTSDDETNLAEWQCRSARSLELQWGEDGGGRAAVVERRRATAVPGRPRRTNSNVSLRVERTSEPLTQTRAKATANRPRCRPIASFRPVVACRLSVACLALHRWGDVFIVGTFTVASPNG